MQDRETALKEQENAREWQAIAYGDHPATWAALAYYRERGWPVDANTFPERDRCENRIFAFKAGYAAALASPLSAPPQAEHEAAHVTALRQMVGMAGEFRRTLLTVRECLDALTPGHRTGYDWNADPLYMTRYVGDALKAIDAGLQSLSRIGAAPAPQGPTGASPQAETSEDEDDVPAVDSWSAPLRKPVVPKILSTDDFYALLRILEVLPVADPFLTDLQSKLSDEERRQHGNRASHLSGPEFVREIERVEALIQSRVQPPALSPVEPTPEPETDLVGLVLNLQAHARKHGWQDCDEPLAALLRKRLVPSEETK